MTPQGPLRSQQDTNIRTIVPIVIEVIRIPKSLSWVILAVRHKPSWQYLDAYEQVHRTVRDTTHYWICVKGGDLSIDALEALASSHYKRDEIWEEIDLRQFD